jgi:hypothetical protein
MAKFTLGFDNRADLAFLSRGSWQDAYPLERLNDYRVPIKARTTDLLPASTQVAFELSEPCHVGIVGLMGTNASEKAAYRVTLYTSFDFATVIYDSGVRQLHPLGTLPYGTIAWGAPNWWTALPTSDEVSRFQNNVPHVLTSPMWAQYGIVEIFDSTNPQGYFEAGRLFVGSIFQPQVNPQGGKTSVHLNSRSSVTRAKDGTPYKQIERPDLSMPFALDWLTRDEAMKILDIQAIVDIHGEVIAIEDPDDVTYAFRRQVFGRLAQLDPIEHSSMAVFEAAFQVEGNL